MLRERLLSRSLLSWLLVLSESRSYRNNFPLSNCDLNLDTLLSSTEVAVAEVEMHAVDLTSFYVSKVAERYCLEVKLCGDICSINFIYTCKFSDEAWESAWEEVI